MSLQAALKRPVSIKSKHLQKTNQFNEASNARMWAMAWYSVSSLGMRLQVVQVSSMPGAQAMTPHKCT